MMRGLWNFMMRKIKLYGSLENRNALESSCEHLNPNDLDIEYPCLKHRLEQFLRIKISTLWRLMVLFALFLMLCLFFTFDGKSKVLGMLKILSDDGISPFSVSIFVLIFVLVTVIGVPASIPCFGAGMVFQPFWAAILVVILSIAIGATVGFIGARYIFKKWALKKLGIIKCRKKTRKGSKKRAAVETNTVEDDISASPSKQAYESSMDSPGKLMEPQEDIGQRRRAKKSGARHTFKILYESARTQTWKLPLLVRFSQLLPFALANYLLALTPLNLWEFLWSSIVGVLPGLLIFIYAGSLLGQAEDSEKDPILTRPSRKTNFSISIATISVIIIALVFIMCLSRRAWRSAARSIVEEERIKKRLRRRLKYRKYFARYSKQSSENQIGVGNSNDCPSSSASTLVDTPEPSPSLLSKDFCPYSFEKNHLFRSISKASEETGCVERPAADNCRYVKPCPRRPLEYSNEVSINVCHESENESDCDLTSDVESVNQFAEEAFNDDSTDFDVECSSRSSDSHSFGSLSESNEPHLDHLSSYERADLLTSPRGSSEIEPLLNDSKIAANTSKTIQIHEYKREPFTRNEKLMMGTVSVFGFLALSIGIGLVQAEII